jgi:hypothetical protein
MTQEKQHDTAGARTQFTVMKNDEGTVGSALMGRLNEVRYSTLVALFGEPLEGDENKVSGEWIVRDADGNLLTIYDWKETDLWDSDLPSVEEFRKVADGRYGHDWNVGGKNREAANKLIAFIEAAKTQPEPEPRKEPEVFEDTITVRELKQLLEDLHDDDRVAFASDYGDHSHTMQVHPLRGSVDLHEIRESAYSHSGYALADDEFDARDDEDQKSVFIIS